MLQITSFRCISVSIYMYVYDSVYETLGESNIGFNDVHLVTWLNHGALKGVITMQLSFKIAVGEYN